MHRLFWLLFSLIECSSVRFWPEHKSYCCSAQFSRGSSKLPPLHAAAASLAVVCGVHTPWLLHTGWVRLLQLFFLISEFSYTVKSRAEARLDYWHPILQTKFEYVQLVKFIFSKKAKKIVLLLLRWCAGSTLLGCSTLAESACYNFFFWFQNFHIP